MIRISVMALMVYCYGAAPFDGLRPAAVDEAVRSFHIDVNRTAREGAVALRSLNDMREMRYLEPYIAEFANATTL